MSYAVGYALLSLLFAGANDFVFKLYSGRDRSRGMYALGIGVVWTSLQVVANLVGGDPVSFDSTSIQFGLAAGVMLAVANILLIESLTHIDVGLGSTVYRLNTIGVVVLSYLLLEEGLGGLKAAGVAFGIVSVLLLYRKHREPAENNVFILFFIVAIAASVGRAFYGITIKSGLQHGADPAAMLLLISATWIPVGAGYALLKEKRYRITLEKVKFSLVSGTLIFLIANFLMLAVEYGEASVVIPIANMSFVVALLISVTRKMEVLTPRKLFAIAAATVSILFLSSV